MTKHIYLISNNLMTKVNSEFLKNVDLNEQRKYTMLSKKGIESTILLSKNENLKNIEAIYSSNYFNALATAKIIAEEKNINNIIVDEDLQERLVGDLESNEFRYLKGMQEHDFNYKLRGGESINEVNDRIKKSLKRIVESDYEQVLMVTHNIAIMSLLIDFCNKGFNLDDHLILDYKEDVIYDGVFHEIDMILLVLEDNKILDIKRLL